MSKNYDKTNVGDALRVELHDTLNLTGAEISINNLPSGACVPFVHSHKNNEEIYIILDGQGYANIDGERISLNAGYVVRISPEAKRQFFANREKSLKYICIQVRANSLNEFTASDAVIY